MKLNQFATLFLFSVFLFGQSDAILPGQKTAIQNLSRSAGLTNEELDNYLMQTYGKGLPGLSRNEGASVIKDFQSEGISKPTQEKIETPGVIETGMNKRFHFRDGSVREGEVLSVSDGKASLKTQSGTFSIPTSEFLSETAEITNKKGEKYNGIVLGETEEEFIIRTSFGDAVVQKRDIQNMKRFHGGVLDRQSEERRQFYQSEAQLLNVFMDPTAFSLGGNTFYLSALSIGYGMTDRFMITSKFGSNFSGDLNLHPRMRFYHRKSAQKETAASWGVGLHRAYSTKSIIGKYSHAINLTKTTDGTTTTRPLNETNYEVSDVIDTSSISKKLYAEAYLVFSSRRVNPTGRGKVGWSVGVKATNAFTSRDEIIKSSFSSSDDNDAPDDESVAWSNEGKYSIPFRCWASLEYDLRKDLKFVGSLWADNGYKTMTLQNTIDDYFGNDGSASFSIDSPKGDVSMIDFDFGLLYAVNDNFRIGVHFQQPFIDIYWEFFEF